MFSLAFIPKPFDIPILATNAVVTLAHGEKFAASHWEGGTSKWRSLPHGQSLHGRYFSKATKKFANAYD
jgi:hypothetical protein